MRALRTALFLACVGLVFGSAGAFAQTKDDGVLDPANGVPPECDITGYKTERQVFPAPVAIPDNNPVGVLLGPIFMPPDGDVINDVILELNMAHTWVGDLKIDLIYDPDCTGPAAGIPATALCRPRGASAAAPPPCGANDATAGCGGDLVSTAPYFISDTASTLLGVGPTCTVTIPPGCYRQSDIGGTPFSIWRGLPKGGCWYLRVTDLEFLDTGSVASWAVFVRNQRPVPAVESSWGAVKNIYR